MTYPTTMALSTIEVMAFVILASMFLTFAIYFIRWFLGRIIK